MFNTIKYIEKKDKYIMETPIFKSDTVSPNELSKNKIFSRVWRFVCKRDFIISNNCYFIENHTYEDEEWVPKIISQYVLLDVKSFLCRINSASFRL